MKKIQEIEKYLKQQEKNEKRELYKKERKQKNIKRKIKYVKHKYIKINNNKEYKKPKKITVPKKFSFIENTNESLKFFDDFFNYIDEGYEKFNFIMTDVEDLGIETLLYMISIDKILKSDNKNIKIKISMPKVESIKYKMYLSGFAKYFTQNLKYDIDEKTIFSIKDGMSTKQNNINEEDVCGDAVDFVKSLVAEDKYKNYIRALYNALVELMQNTHDHAYDEEEEIDEDNTRRTWYLFAVQLTNGIAFYFFDNGKGITKTARKSIIEKAFGKISLEQCKILESTLNGEYRSVTNLPNRNKGLPQINELLKNNDIMSSIILTNKVVNYYDLKSKTNMFKKIDYNFKGSLFVWILPSND